MRPFGSFFRRTTSRLSLPAWSSKSIVLVLALVLVLVLVLECALRPLKACRFLFAPRRCPANHVCYIESHLFVADDFHGSRSAPHPTPPRARRTRRSNRR